MGYAHGQAWFIHFSAFASGMQVARSGLPPIQATGGGSYGGMGWESQGLDAASGDDADALGSLTQGNCSPSPLGGRPADCDRISIGNEYVWDAHTGREIRDTGHSLPSWSSLSLATEAAL